MTTLTYAANTIMAYVGADSDVVGKASVTGLPVWAGDKFYLPSLGTGAHSGWRQFDIDPDGDETLQKNIGTIGITQVDTGTGGAAAVSADGAYLYHVSTNGNLAQYAKIQASDLTLVGTFGTAQSLDPDDSTHILYPYVLFPLSGNLLSASQSTLQKIDRIALPAFSARTNVGALDTAGTTFGAMLGPGGSHAYAIGVPWANGSTNSTLSFKLYKITSGTSLSTIGSVAPAAIDATWTHTYQVSGCGYDEVDGNIILGVQTLDVVTNKQYIIKLNATTAAVMWAIPVNYLTPYSWSFSFSRITNSRYHYLGVSSLVYHINTSAGTASTETVTGLFAGGPQFSDGTTNSIIQYGTFTAAGSPPNYVGTIMDTGGNHNLTAWMRFWFATMGGEEPPGGGDGGNQGGLALSSVRGWTYTLDGHTFYVLELLTEGTWVVDLGTGQWSRFYTSGFSGRWDAVNGIMWGNRVVAGDISSTSSQLWEISADELKDNDSLDIAHVVTGGLQTRSRVKHSVDAVRLSASVGKLGTGTIADVKLRWSDDNGNSWSSYRTVTLTEGTNGTEIAYRSLGSFAAPGRVFEISDTGGPLRLDGCDGEIDGLDGNDSPG